MNAFKNAKIRSVQIGFEDHGILTCWLNLDYGGCSQGFGGYGFSHRPRGQGNVGAADFADYILGVLDALEVRAWEDLPGTSVRAEIRDGIVVRIGHFLKDDQWFDPRPLLNKRKSV